MLCGAGIVSLEPDFYKKPLATLSSEEWEALCDGCGRCCYRTLLTGRGKRTRLHYTRIACNLLNLKTGSCSAYSERFSRCAECTHLTIRNVGKCDWLPETCAYRRLYYKQPLPDWHPLITHDADSTRKAGVQIQNGVHECDINPDDWQQYVIGERGAE